MRHKGKDLRRVNGASCNNCASTDIFWRRLVSASDIHVRWCWTCGNMKLHGFNNVFNGGPLKPAVRRF
jgi:Zn ribbon nucleic-acid-binding protein